MAFTSTAGAGPTKTAPLASSSPLCPEQAYVAEDEIKYAINQPGSRSEIPDHPEGPDVPSDVPHCGPHQPPRCPSGSVVDATNSFYWARDATFTLLALVNSGVTCEAADWRGPIFSGTLSFPAGNSPGNASRPGSARAIIARL